MFRPTGALLDTFSLSWFIPVLRLLFGRESEGSMKSTRLSSWISSKLTGVSNAILLKLSDTASPSSGWFTSLPTDSPAESSESSGIRIAKSGWLGWSYPGCETFLAMPFVCSLLRPNRFEGLGFEAFTCACWSSLSHDAGRTPLILRCSFWSCRPSLFCGASGVVVREFPWVLTFSSASLSLSARELETGTIPVS